MSNSYIRLMSKEFETFRYRHNLANVFEDFLILAACTLSNSVNLLRWQERENKYMSIVKKYTPDEANQFARILGMLVAALDEKPNDYLGMLFMELELYDSWKGQFFTPYDVARLMAEMTMKQQLKDKLDRGELIRVNDAAVGGGVTLIAAFQVIKDLGYNPQQCARFYAADLDIKAVCMTYIQLSLLGAHATVWHMNTLTLQHFDTWLSPAVFLGMGRGLQSNSVEKEPEITHEMMGKVEQLTLF